MMRALAFLLLLAPSLAWGQSMSGGCPHDTSSCTSAATGGTTARTLANRAADVVNIQDFGADPTGVADSTPAFNLAIASVASGKPIHIYVPPGTYRCDTSWLEQGRHAWVDLDSGAQACGNYGGTGAGVVFAGRITQTTGNVRTTDTQGGLSLNGTQFVGDVLRTQNNANVAGLGIYRTYTNFDAVATNSNGGDIGRQLISRWINLSSPGLFGDWRIAVSPLTDATSSANGMHWGLRGEEMNPINNGPDPGYIVQEGTAANWVGGISVIPDTWAPTGGYGGNTWSSFAAIGNPIPNNRWTSYPAQFGSTAPSALSGTDAFTVNGTTISGWTTGNATEVASKIVSAGIANTSASVDTFGRVVIYMTTANGAGSLVLANSVGTPLAKLGLSAGTFTTPLGNASIYGSNSPSLVGTAKSISLNGTTIALNIGTGTVADVVTAINAAGIANTAALADYQGRLVIVNTLPAALTIANVSGTPLTDLGITAGTFRPTTPPTDLPSKPKTYNGFIARPDSIAPAGVGLYLGGDTTGTTALFPASPLVVTGNWTHGIDLTGAAFTDYSLKLPGFTAFTTGGSAPVFDTAAPAIRIAGGNIPYLLLQADASTTVGRLGRPANRNSFEVAGYDSIVLKPALTAAGMVEIGGGATSIASGACGTGTNGSVSGNNNVGHITIGAAATTACVVSFSGTVPAAPLSCTISPTTSASAAATVLPFISAKSTAGFTVSGAALASTSFDYQCI